LRTTDFKTFPEAQAEERRRSAGDGAADAHVNLFTRVNAIHPGTLRRNDGAPHRVSIRAQALRC
jgi:hypothetical protein